MDPNTTLAIIRENVQVLDSHDYHIGHPVADLLDAVENLDVWLSRGGFLPTAWSHPEGDRKGTILDETV